jgi:hypothetical protein
MKSGKRFLFGNPEVEVNALRDYTDAGMVRPTELATRRTGGQTGQNL